MKISNWRRALWMGVISAFATTLGCIVFTYIMNILTGGIAVVSVSMYPDMQTIASVYVPIVLMSSGVLSALISLLLLRYTSAKFLLVYLPVSMTLYIALYLSVYFIVLPLAKNTALCTWDFLLYSTILFPAGAAVGTLLSIIINQVKNHRT